MIVGEKNLHEKVEGKQRETATYQRPRLNFLVSPPTHLSLMMNHTAIFSLNSSQVLDFVATLCSHLTLTL